MGVHLPKLKPNAFRGRGGLYEKALEMYKIHYTSYDIRSEHQY
jgi:hypothetical protein